MQSVFGLHDRSQFIVHVYASSKSDNSEYRRKIEHESERFIDVSEWTTQQLVDQIVRDGIHICSCVKILHFAHLAHLPRSDQPEWVHERCS